MSNIIESVASIDYQKNFGPISEYITFESFLEFSVIYFFIIWVTIVIWVTMDITNRSSNILLQLMCILFVIVLGPLGLLLYLIVRPKSRVSKKFIEEIEYNLGILSNIVEEGKNHLKLCPKCSNKIKKDFKYCPICKIELDKKCSKCKNTIISDWKSCPFCSAKIKLEKKEILKKKALSKNNNKSKKK